MLAERIVTVIPPNPILLEELQRKPKKARVAAYCRVSTDEEEQQNSYKVQKEYFTDKINKNRDWEMVDVFADEGISGTGTKKRAEFLKLMKLCEKGKVDIILTKSISRFARNTLDSISYVRMLRSKGIAVIFEKEGINTMAMSSEMIFTVLSAFAQAESESISQNVTWGKRRSFKNGKVTFQYSRFLGYEKGEDGQPKIVPEQAEIVKRIFYSYLSGYSADKIKKELEGEGVISATGKPEWSIHTIQYMLTNEKYIGDAILQKTYVVDFITKKSKKNNGEIPQYYVTGNHEGIIPKDIFNRVQEEMARRGNKRKVSQKNTKTEHGKYSGKYALSELLVCGECGTRYRRVTWARGGKKKIVWRCINRLEYGTKHCNDSPTIEEYKLQDAIVRAVNRLTDDKDEVAATLKDSLQLALSAGEDTIDKVAIGSRIRELQATMLDLVQVSAKSSSGADFLDEKCKEISDEIKGLQETLQRHEQRQTSAQNTLSRMGEILALLESENLNLTEYDEALVRQNIEEVKVLSEDKVMVVFKSGLEVEMGL